jgi:hypothetical protein
LDDHVVASSTLGWSQIAAIVARGSLPLIKTITFTRPCVSTRITNILPGDFAGNLTKSNFSGFWVFGGEW